MTREVHPKLTSILLAAGSATALWLAATAAQAQVCTPVTPVAGDTVTCTPGVYPTGISYAVDDLTVVVGTSGGASSDISNAAGSAVQITTNSGDLDLSIYNTASSAESTNGHGIYAVGLGSTVNVSVSHEGHAEGSFHGARIRNLGSGATNIDIRSLTGNGSAGLTAYGAASTTTMNVTVSSGAIGQSVAVSANHRGTGDLTMNIGSAYSYTSRGVEAITSTHNVNQTVTLTSFASGRSNGLYSRTYGGATITTQNVTSRGSGATAAQGIRVRLRNA